MDRQQENDNQQKSSVDRVNQVYDNALRLRRAYKKTKGLRTAVNAFRAARAGATVAQGAGAVAGGISGGTAAAIIFLILLIIFLIIMIFVVIFGGNQNVNAGTPPECTTIGGTCGTTCQSPNVLDTSGASCSASLTGETQVCCVPPPPPDTGTAPTCDTNNPVKSLKDNFNIAVTGTSNNTLLSKICFAFAYASKSSGYLSKLIATGNTLYINAVSDTKCWAFTPDQNHITLHNGGCASLSQTSITYLLIHESGHVIADRNPRLYQNYPHSSLAQSDTTCWQYSSTTCTGSLRAGYFLKSYPLRYYCTGWGGCVTQINARSESFAESVVDYLTSTSYWKTGMAGLCARTISSFSSTCSNTFSWLKNNVYGGYTFY